MRHLSLGEVLELHRRVVEAAGGAGAVRDLGLLESAVVQPRMTFGGQDLYPELADKAAALGYSLIQNHPFIDGNKRVGHAAMEALLMLNGAELEAGVDEAERVILDAAAGRITKESFAEWVRSHVRRLAD